MSRYIVDLVVHFLAVTVGLYVLWSVIGGMRGMGRSGRLFAALTAGAISAAVMFVIRLVV